MLFPSLWGTRQVDPRSADAWRLFDQFMRGFDTGSGSQRTATIPPVNLWVTEEAAHVEAAVPGYTLEDIDVQVLEGELTLSGRRSETLAENTTRHRQERAMEAFARTVELPVRVDIDAAAAELVQGVLHITLPRAQETRPRRIPVRGKE